MDQRPQPVWKFRAYRSYFTLEPTLPTHTPAKLAVHRRTGVIREYDSAWTPPGEQEIASEKVFAALGIIHMTTDSFLFLVSKVELVGTIQGSQILKVAKVDAATLNPHIDNIKKLFTKGFYFSYNYDLTSSLQRQYNAKKNWTAAKNLHEQADPRYYWNLKMYEDFLAQGVPSRWLVPLMQGFVTISNLSVLGQPLKFVLLSRRRNLHAGTRFNARGINDSGDCANYVETEQCISYGKKWCSHVQIRGSVPLFWQQRGVTAQLTITRSPELAKKPFEKHMSQLAKDYSLVMFLNLLTKPKGWEWKLTEALENMFQNCDLKFAKYKYYDFHEECRGNKFQKVSTDLIPSIEMLIQNFSFFEMNEDERVAREVQKGVFRTNCLDCLDRTNVVQTKIAMNVLEYQLEKLQISTKAVYGMNLNTMADRNQDVPFVKVLKAAWADMGDALSEQYAGSGSTISGVTRTGKQGFFGKLHHGVKSINRFIANNFQDNFKQEGLDMILSRHPINVPRGIRYEVEKELLKYEAEFQSRTFFRTYAVTWNLGGNCPTSDTATDLYKLGMLVKQEVKAADIIIISLQEIVKLNASQVLSGKDPKRIAFWDNTINLNLNANQADKLVTAKRFFRIETKSMVGCFLSIYVSHEFQHRISEIQSSKVKQGMNGNAGNKGAVLARFNIDDSSFCVINSHLASGIKDTKQRLDQVNEIFRQGFKKDVKYAQGLSILDHNIIIFMGDMNFRIQGIDNEVVRNLARKGEVGMLCKNDQLLFYKDQHPILSQFEEGLLRFPPTFKFDRFSESYDTSKKYRVPAWCDRILWHKKAPMKLINYKSMPANFSDHRPVTATLEVNLVKESAEKKRVIRQRLFDSYKDEMKLLQMEANLQTVKPPELNIEQDYCKRCGFTLVDLYKDDENGGAEEMKEMPASMPVRAQGGLGAAVGGGTGTADLLDLSLDMTPSEAIAGRETTAVAGRQTVAVAPPSSTGNLIDYEHCDMSSEEEPAVVAQRAQLPVMAQFDLINNNAEPKLEQSSSNGKSGGDNLIDLNTPSPRKGFNYGQEYFSGPVLDLDLTEHEAGEVGEAEAAVAPAASSNSEFDELFN